MAVSGILAAALSALGGVAGAVGQGAAGAAKGPAAASLPKAGAAPFTPTAANFQAQGVNAPPGADLRLSDLVGQQRRPDDDMRLSMMMGGYS